MAMRKQDPESKERRVLETAKETVEPKRVVTAEKMMLTQVLRQSQKRGVRVFATPKSKCQSTWVN